MGKDAGDDFRDGKVTLPVILAYARGNEEEKQFWRKAIAGHLTSDDDLSHATALLQKSGAIADTLARARHYGQRAIDALGAFAGGKAKAALTEIGRATSELQSLMRISYAVFCLKKKNTKQSAITQNIARINQKNNII